MAPTEVKSIQAEARECWEEADGNKERAVELMTRRLREREDLLGAIIRRAASDYLSQMHTIERKEIIEQKPDRGLSALVDTARSWMDYKVEGKPMGDCSKEDLERAAFWRVKTAKSNMMEAKFFGRVAQAMGDAPTVKDALTDSQLAKLHLAAERSE